MLFFFLIISEDNIADSLVLDHSISDLRVVSLGDLCVSQENGLEGMIIGILYLADDEAHFHIFHLLFLQLVQVDVCVL